MVSYPAKSRIVPSFESSGRNATGATHVVPLPAQVRAMQAYRPMQRLGVVYNPLETNSVLNVRELKALGERNGFDVLDVPVELDAEGAPTAASLPRLIAELAAQEPQFLYIGPDSFIGENRDVVIESALQHRLPTFTSTELEILRGRALLGLVTRYYNLGRYMAHLVERILIDGERPADIPVDTLSRFTYAVRLSVAAELGLYPPMDVLNYAHVLDRADTNTTNR
jgi:putative ABC transport system substrate-binding protein